MKRKVIQIANSTQLISLPRKWAVQYGIKKGDELDVEEQGSKILISTEEKSKHSEIEVKVDGLDKDSLIFLLRGLFIRGYDQIKFMFDKPHVFHHRLNKEVTISSVIHKEVAICPGLDIIQERGNFFVLKNISVSSIKEFDTILKRIFLLLMDTAHDLYLGAKNKDYVLLETFQDKHDNITRLINYNLKTLNTIGYSDHKNTIALFNVLSALDIAIDNLKNAARHILKVKMKPGTKAVNILNQIQESIRLHYKLYYNFSTENAEKFVSSRQEILDSINKQIKDLSKQEIVIIVMVEQVLEILRDLYASRMGMEY